MSVPRRPPDSPVFDAAAPFSKLLEALIIDELDKPVA
jgi:hypothetical protein